MMLNLKKYALNATATVGLMIALLASQSAMSMSTITLAVEQPGVIANCGNLWCGD